MRDLNARYPLDNW